LRANAQSETTVCRGSVYALTSPDATPHIDVALNGRHSVSLIDYGATKGTLWTRAALRPGAVTEVATALPGTPENEFLLRQSNAGDAAIIGTDLLSHLTLMLDARAATILPKPCTASVLRTAGFAPIRQSGFFSSDPAHVESDRPNVPVLFVQIGRVRTWAQIDTGYDDRLYPYSIDINQALYRRLGESGVRLRPEGSVMVKTCEGLESRRVYSAANAPLIVETDDGKPIRHTVSYYLIVKSASGCGGIGAMSAPAAQLGASFLRMFQTIIFDPKAETVWIKQEASASRAEHE
jgi:hypothetical protein